MERPFSRLLNMAAPSMVTRSGNNLIVRSVVSGDPLFGTEVKEDHDDFNYYDVTDSEAEREAPEVAEEEEEDEEGEEEDEELPQCKVKRNYSCPQCDYYTQNPRFYLYHQKQVHNQKIKIYECDHCLYASKHSQKLQRHVHMVHVMGKQKMDKIKIKSNNKSSKNTQEKVETETIAQTEENVEDGNEPMYDENGAQIYKCSVCDMKSKNRVMVARHERLAHLKKKFYRCTKCNYVTHMKARYTKHVKYHSMPMIKCDLCDFRTPYKWNLDRHNKNHTGDGPFKCSICNFTAEIKQSLTVHEMNHHVPPVGHLIVNSNNNNNRRRLKVGASDTMGLVTEEDQIEQSELELLRLERESSYDQNPAEFVQTQLNVQPSEPEAAAPSSAASSGSVQRPEPDSRPQLIQIHKYSCKACDFKGNLGEVQRHEQEKHQIVGIFPEKKKRPIPNLIPIQAQKSLVRPSELTKENVSKLHSGEPFKDLVTLVSIDSPSKETDSNKGFSFMDQDKKSDSFRKKNASFFDKLKEKLMTSASIEGTLTCTFCGHEAKCLSEHMKHQKSHIPGERDDESESSFGSFGVPAIESSSTRCQHCRHRCKTSADLVLHLQKCHEATSFRQSDDTPDDVPVGDDASTTEPHPMENKVFIWNDLSENAPSISSEIHTDSKSKHSPSESPSKVITGEKVFVGIEVKPGYGTTTNNGQEEPITSKDVNTKKVFKCPHCSFWASTASRFHVHIVGHLNKRPFQCSLCLYSSNWRWDITKHIRLKTIRDPTHEKARVLLTDETGRRNYSKYNKYLTTMKMENQQAAKLPRKILPKDGAQQPVSDQQSLNQPSVGTKRSAMTDDEESSPKKKPHTENKKTMWKCKKCYFRDSDREVVLEHVRDHYRNASEAAKKKKKTSSKSTTFKKEEENSNPENKSEPNVVCPPFMCETCPYTSETWSELEGHSEKHFVCTVNGKQLKCQFCSFYAQDNEELSVHSLIHGESAANDGSDKSSALSCSLCPYVATNRTQLVYHQGRHNRDDSPHKCYKCSYVAPNNTILALHVRLHGRHTTSDNNDVKSTCAASHSTEISDPDSSISQNHMVWVVKSRGLVKMYKCRYCLLTNSRKNVVVDHEKMHSADSSAQYKCLDCHFVSSNGPALTSHCKSHRSIYSQIVGVVDSTKSDEEQINQVKESVNRGEIDGLILNGEVEKSPLQMEKEAVERVLRFCNLCPARFLFAKEMKIHMRFHELNLLFKCDSCTYTARQKQHLEAHFKVHTDEYQERTNVLTGVYGTDSTNPRPKITSVIGDKNDSIWVVVKEEQEDPVKPKEKPFEPNGRTAAPTKQFTCDKCPAEFFKSVALSYHETLHGGPGPHKCKYCDYAVKTYGNLIRHEAVHKNDAPKRTVKADSDHRHKRESSPVKSPTKSPPSTPLTIDPEFGMLIHGSPDFVYPTYLRNGKPKEKRYKCHKCPSAFEKRDQYKIHLSLHGSRQRYRCDRCDYSVKYYANFTQHIKKHESCDMTSKGKKNDEDVGGERLMKNDGNKLKYSTADEQTIMMMQQKTVANLTLVDKDVHSRCPHCPYTNTRRDGVSGHLRCHSNPKGGPYVCKFCDYTVPQLHFLREHAKIHFNLPKFFKPDAYMKVDRLEIWAEPVDAVSSDEKFLVFKDRGDKTKEDRFLPKIDLGRFDNGKGRVYVNLRTGEEEAEAADVEEVDSNKSSFVVETKNDDSGYLPKTEPIDNDKIDVAEEVADVIETDVQNNDLGVAPTNGAMEFSKSSCSSDSDCSDLSAQDNNGNPLTNSIPEAMAIAE